MPDIQKIILGMECCVSPQIRCRECPYRPEGVACDKRMLSDTLMILWKLQREGEYHVGE